MQRRGGNYNLFQVIRRRNFYFIALLITFLLDFFPSINAYFRTIIKVIAFILFVLDTLGFYFSIKTNPKANNDPSEMNPIQGLSLNELYNFNIRLENVILTPENREALIIIKNHLNNIIK